MNNNKDFGFGNEVCSKCGEEIYNSETLSRCLRCGKSTPREMSGKEYFKNKHNHGDDNIED
jgi:predicted amidophosphoribosyltransferase